MTDEEKGKYQNRIITIPNILSFFRLCLIPLFIWLYALRKSYIPATIVLLISGITDIADGIIARKFNMVSNFGKAFDPISDKLTQIAVLFCFVTRFPNMLFPLVIMTFKETLAAAINIITIKKSGEVPGAVWHGKLNTVFLYSVMLIHFIWFNIPALFSDILIIVCTAVMLLSGVLYNIRSIRIIRNLKEKKNV